jgi:hypothetical protein
MPKVRNIQLKKKPTKNIVYKTVDVNKTLKPKMNDDGSMKLNSMEQIEEVSSYETLSSILDSVLKQKNKLNIQKILRNFQDKLKPFAIQLEEIGDSYGSRKASKDIPKAINSILSDLQSDSPKEFFRKFKNIQELFESLNQNREVKSEESLPYDFDISEFKDIKNVKIDIKDKGSIVCIPVSLMLSRPISPSVKAVLEKDGAKFASGVGMVILPHPRFFVINKSKFSGNLSTSINIILEAMSKNDSSKFNAIKDVSKDMNKYYLELIVQDKYIRHYTELFSAATNIKIHAVE